MQEKHGHPGQNAISLCHLAVLTKITGITKTENRCWFESNLANKSGLIENRKAREQGTHGGVCQNSFATLLDWRCKVGVNLAMSHEGRYLGHQIANNLLDGWNRLKSLQGLRGHRNCFHNLGRSSTGSNE